MPSIYLITCLPTGKYYVGKTANTLEHRWYQHCHPGDDKRGHLANAIRKYGKENFVIELLTECAAEEVDNLERLWIAVLNSTDRTVGLNIKHGGEGGPIPLETRLKIARSNTGKKLSESALQKKREAGKRLTGERNGFYGHTHSEETKQHWSGIRKGSVPPNKGKPGKPMTSAHREKLNAAITYTHIPAADVESLYLSGQSIKEVAKHFGVSGTAIRDRLIARKVPMRKGRRFTTEQRRAMSLAMEGNRNGFRVITDAFSE